MCCALQELLPHAEYYKRGGFSLKKIVQFASNRDYTDLLVFNEDSKHVSRGPACPCVCVCVRWGQQARGCGWLFLRVYYPGRQA